MGIFGCLWARLNAEEMVTMLDKQLKDQSHSDVVTKQDWILASDFRAISLVALIALCIGLCATFKGLKVAKADVEKMCEK